MLGAEGPGEHDAGAPHGEEHDGSHGRQSLLHGCGSQEDGHGGGVHSD